MILCYTERANQDIDLAIAWYERQKTGLGMAFLDCLEQAIAHIIGHPRSYQTCYAEFRACPIRRFPFTIFYTIESDEIVVHAVFANRLDPEKRPDSSD